MSDKESEFALRDSESEYLGQLLADLLVSVMKMGLGNRDSHEYAAAQTLCDLMERIAKIDDPDYRRIVVKTAENVRVREHYPSPEKVELDLVKLAVSYYLERISSDGFAGARASKVSSKLRSAIAEFDRRQEEAVRLWRARRTEESPGEL